MTFKKICCNFAKALSAMILSSLFFMNGCLLHNLRIYLDTKTMLKGGLQGQTKQKQISVSQANDAVNGAKTVLLYLQYASSKKWRSY